MEGFVLLTRIITELLHDESVFTPAQRGAVNLQFWRFFNAERDAIHVDECPLRVLTHPEGKSAKDCKSKGCAYAEFRRAMKEAKRDEETSKRKR